MTYVRCPRCTVVLDERLGLPELVSEEDCGVCLCTRRISVDRAREYYAETGYDLAGERPTLRELADEGD